MIRKVSLALSALALAAGIALSPARAAAQRSQAVTCQSTGYDRTYCSADTRYGVRLSRQFSEASCVQGRTWGADRRGIWVSRGCRAQFVVGGSSSSNGGWDDRWNSRNDDRWDDRGNRRNIQNRAERVCRNVVRDRYRNIRNSDIDVGLRSRARDGDYLVSWRTNRASGSCRVNSSGQVVNFNVARR